jgi:hypothetical protein
MQTKQMRVIAVVWLLWIGLSGVRLAQTALYWGAPGSPAYPPLVLLVGRWLLWAAVVAGAAVGLLKGLRWAWWAMLAAAALTALRALFPALPRLTIGQFWALPSLALAVYTVCMLMLNRPPRGEPAPAPTDAAGPAAAHERRPAWPGSRGLAAVWLVLACISAVPALLLIGAVVFAGPGGTNEASGVVVLLGAAIFIFGTLPVLIASVALLRLRAWAWYQLMALAMLHTLGWGMGLLRTLPQVGRSGFEPWALGIILMLLISGYTIYALATDPPRKWAAGPEAAAPAEG